MVLPLHLGLDHLGPLLLVFGAGVAFAAAIWYLVTRPGFRARGA